MSARGRNEQDEQPEYYVLGVALGVLAAMFVSPIIVSVLLALGVK